MDPVAGAAAAGLGWLPRTRGDGPCRKGSCGCVTEASPHTRGWTRHGDHASRCEDGFPAHAGMDPELCAVHAARPRLPRTRGDGPAGAGVPTPRPEASPHTRGWTLARQGHRVAVDGFPAHAGMDPSRAARPPGRRGLPRTRGDGPESPARLYRWLTASPHTRGWTRGAVRAVVQVAGFPAHAGMDPSRAPSRSSRTRLPRTRGDGPQSDSVSVASYPASPHTRGWTCGRPATNAYPAGFPAHAGVRQHEKVINSRRLPSHLPCCLVSSRS